MKKTILAIIIMLTSVVSMAQSRYCMSYLDYLTNTWYPLERLEFENRSGERSLWFGGGFIIPKTGERATDKLLKKKARFIIHNDSLYVNCRGLSVKGVNFGNWYSPASVYDKQYFLFTAMSIKSRGNTASAAFMFGIMGGAIAASMYKESYQCYLLKPSNADDAFVEPIDEDYMLKLLEGHDDILAEYKAASKEQNSYSPNVVIPILKKLGLVK